MARPDVAPIVYDFQKSWYENYYSNRLNSMSTTGDFNDMYETAWKDRRATITIDGAVVDNGVDIKQFVQLYFNGDTPLCMIDKLASDIGELIGKLPGGCDLGKAIFKAIDSITNVFGTFICTATIEAIGHKESSCVLDMLKEYRDKEVANTAEGLKMIRYYGVLGPRIVRHIKEDAEREVIYKYLYAEYISPLQTAVKSKENSKVFHIYFRLMEDMVQRYNIKTSKRFKQWVAK